MQTATEWLIAHPAVDDSAGQATSPSCDEADNYFETQFGDEIDAVITELRRAESTYTRDPAAVKKAAVIGGILGAIAAALVCRDQSTATIVLGALAGASAGASVGAGATTVHAAWPVLPHHTRRQILNILSRVLTGQSYTDATDAVILADAARH